MDCHCSFPEGHKSSVRRNSCARRRVCSEGLRVLTVEIKAAGFFRMGRGRATLQKVATSLHSAIKQKLCAFFTCNIWLGRRNAEELRLWSTFAWNKREKWRSIVPGSSTQLWIFYTAFSTKLLCRKDAKGRHPPQISKHELCKNFHICTWDGTC